MQIVAQRREYFLLKEKTTILLYGMRHNKYSIVIQLMNWSAQYEATHKLALDFKLILPSLSNGY